jgi:uncharacterized protein YqfA (UPF0365 family)
MSGNPWLVGALVCLAVSLLLLFAAWSGLLRGLSDAARMRLLGVPGGRVRACVRQAREAGVPLTVRQVEAHHLAGGNIETCTRVLVAARRQGLAPEWDHVSGAELLGLDLATALDVWREAGRTFFDEELIRRVEERRGSSD